MSEIIHRIKNADVNLSSLDEIAGLIFLIVTATKLVKAAINIKNISIKLHQTVRMEKVQTSITITTMNASHAKALLFNILFIILFYKYLMLTI